MHLNAQTKEKRPFIIREFLLEIFRNFLTGMFGIENCFITEMNNPTKRMMDAYFSATRRDFMAAKKSKDVELCFWVYYAGHGVMNNTNFIVLNERNNADRYFNLERQVWILTGNYKNTCAFIFFDSCREEITRE